MTLGLSGAAIAGLAVGGATLASGFISSRAAGEAADTQAEAAAQGTAEQRRQFEEIQKLFAPFIQGGTNAFGEQQNLLGLNGNTAQQTSLNGIANSPEYQTLIRQGENSILQNASATGGLRGGNVQDALSRFRPQLLNQLIQQRFSNLGSLSQFGQSSAAGQATIGANNATNIASLLGQEGAASAGGILGQAQGYGNALNGITSGLGVFRGLGGKF